MRCPYCKAPTSVLATRVSSDGCSIKRRRLCSNCSQVFTTLETASLQVISSPGVLNPFSRRPVIAKVRTAAARRPEVEDAAARRSRSRKPCLGSTPPPCILARRSSEPGMNGHVPFTLRSLLRAGVEPALQI
ncbi:hypothetical protein ACH4Q7_01775 [Streptomyces roseolus]|uniref:NrdR family transcriptional regulator n=1 Tax=Streptomyces roseolus TaxID=67358 RepID=UPI0037BAE7E0